MKSRLLLAGLCCFPLTSYTADSLYCAGNHGTIQLGMSTMDVIAACGAPLSKEQSKQDATINVPVSQLMYTQLNTGAVYDGLNITYQMWSLPTGAKGVNLQVNIMDGKISSLSFDGSGSNASDVCNGNRLAIGDPVENVYSACGSPTMVNQTYIKQAIPGSAKPEIWTYQIDPYQPPFHLTFLNGTLQSIN